MRLKKVNKNIIIESDMLALLAYHPDIINHMCKVDKSNNLLVYLLSTCKEANQYGVWSEGKKPFESVLHIVFSHDYYYRERKTLVLPSCLISLTLGSKYKGLLTIPPFS